MIGIVVGELQEALHARRRVIRPLPLKAMRQLQHQATRLAPPLLACPMHIDIMSITCGLLQG